MTIRAATNPSAWSRGLRTLALTAGAAGLLAGLCGCNFSREMATSSLDIGRSQPAKLRSTATQTHTPMSARQPQQRTMLVASDNLGGRIFPDATLPATASSNTAVATVPTTDQ